MQSLVWVTWVYLVSYFITRDVRFAGATVQRLHIIVGNGGNIQIACQYYAWLCTLVEQYKHTSIQI